MKYYYSFDTDTDIMEKVDLYEKTLELEKFVEFDKICKAATYPYKLNVENLFLDDKTEPMVFIRRCLYLILHDDYNIQNDRYLASLFNRKNPSTITIGIKKTRDYIFGQQKDSKYVICYNTIVANLLKRGYLKKILIVS